MKNKNISLSQKTISIILGSILGNGSLKLDPGYSEARLNIIQSISQKSYFDYKVSALSEINKIDYKIIESKLENNNPKKLYYNSSCLSELTEIYNLTYKKNKINILRKWTNLLSPLALCIWWLDKGIIINNTQGIICTDGFELEKIKILIRTLRINWKVESKIHVINKIYKGKNKIYYRIGINKENLENFLKIIIPNIPIEEMLYKGIIRNKNKELQQRWISEIKNLIKPEMREKYIKLTEEKDQRMI